MPALEKEIIQHILSCKSSSFPIFVETGTYMGETLQVMQPLFERLYTIDIKDEFINNLKSGYTGSKINFILGDSSVELEKLTNVLDNNTVFFLDAHWSVGNTGRGTKDCPLYEEVTGICNNFKHTGIIIIDDFRLFGVGPNTTGEIYNWEDIRKDRIVEILGARVEKVYHLPSSFHPEDRLIIEINKI
jgi:hypothetical protein